MVRVLAAFLTLTIAISAHAGEQDIDKLAKIVRESTDLEAVNLSLNELFKISKSPVMNAEVKRQAGMALFTLSIESTARILNKEKPEREAEDLLTIHVAELGLVEKSNVMDIEKMVALGSNRVKLAATIFLRDHFSAPNPYEGFFPARPESGETTAANWETPWMISVIEKMPVILAKISYNGSLNRNSNLGEVSAATYTQITRTLYEAARDVKPDLTATRQAMAIRMFRQRLAVHWMDELSKTLLAWKQVRFPNPEVTPETKPDNPRAVDPLAELDLRPVRNCEGNMVTPVTTNRSNSLH